jgi:hypothetical protein
MCFNNSSNSSRSWKKKNEKIEPKINFMITRQQ